VTSELSIMDTDMASTGYIGQREKGSKRIYPLGDLVGEASKFHLRLIKWDGLYIVSGSPFISGSILYQNPNPDFG
jgi:hypothetical protein